MENYDIEKDSITTYKEATERYKHENKDILCYCCNELHNENDIIELHLGDRGYGSSFDGSDSHIKLCKNCLKPEYIEWFNEQPTIDEHCEDYKYEKNIIDLVNTFPLENQEYFWNSNCDGWNADIIMDRQDWIDMKNGVMSDEKYKEYCMYSPSEVKAYEEKFPTCEYPVNRVYDDGSIGCWCPFKASGMKDQRADVNISAECCYCEYYKKRETPLKDIKNEDFKNYKTYMIGKLKSNEFKNKFE